MRQNFHGWSKQRGTDDGSGQNGLSKHSGSVVESLTRDQGVPGSENHRRHCVGSLGKTQLSLLSTGSTQEDPFRLN